MELTSENVRAVLGDCLLTGEEVIALSLQGANSNRAEELADAGHLVKVECVVNDFAFHPERLESHRADVADMLTQLPEDFRADKGGGWTFLNLCMRADGHQWGEQVNAEQLCALAIALGLGKWLLPKQYWNVLPGGMPYFAVGDFDKED